MNTLLPSSITSIAVVGAHCDDIAIGAGATLMQLTRAYPDAVVNALVLCGAGTEREIEEKNAFAAMCGTSEVRMTVADIPDGRVPEHWGSAKKRVAEFRKSCDPDLVIGPQRADRHQDHRLLAELIPTEFRDHLTLGYEILKWESDLPTPNLYIPVDPEVANEKVGALHECYHSQLGRDWFDHESFLAMMRVRGAQCHRRYAEAFVVDKAVLSIAPSEA